MSVFQLHNGIKSVLSPAGELTAARGLNGILGAYGDQYIVTDLRTRSKKNMPSVKNLSTNNLKFEIKRKAPINYNEEAYHDSVKYVKLERANIWKENENFLFLDFHWNSSSFKEVPFLKSECYNYYGIDGTNHTSDIYLKSVYFYNTLLKFLTDNKLLSKYPGAKAVINSELERLKSKGLGAYGDTYTVVDLRKKSKKDLEDLKPMQGKFSVFYTGKDESLGKPTIKFEFETNKELQDFLKENKENLIDSYIDVTPEEERTHEDQYKLTGSDSLPAEMFNCAESDLTCYGMSPTYTRLNDYSSLIEPFDGQNKFVGYGFDKTTLVLLADTVKKYYRQVSKLAAHLKGDSEKQSAFNIWHWLHCNVKYNYDSPGKEEIRTPARTWADRASGVDCDCLAVFTYSLLVNMGYQPSFEIVAFDNKDTYSHIYVNLNGLAIDRVLPWFAVRPNLITKKLIMTVPVYSLSGCNLGRVKKKAKKLAPVTGGNISLQHGGNSAKTVTTSNSGFFKKVSSAAIKAKAVKSQAALHGIYEKALRKVGNGTATDKDVLDLQKSHILISLAKTDYNGFRLGSLVMPHVVGIDSDGAYYFDNVEIAKIAKEGENSILKAEERGASEEELEGIFKKIGSAIKKVAKATAKVVAAPVKATVKATTTAVKAATNAVKATANVVKAGVQAATGNTTAAKETLKKAGSQVKAATVTAVKDTVKSTVVEPTKTVAQSTKTIVKETIVNPIATTVKIAGKVFKVIFIKINPVTVLMRNSLRALVALNFLGMSTRLNVANMTESEAIAAGYTAEQYADAVKAKKRVCNFFVKMGGKLANIEKSIVNGSKRKALFKKDYTNNTKVNVTDDDATLGDFTIGSCLAAVGAFFAKIWKWIKKIVPKVVQTVKNVAEKVAAAKGNSTETEDTSTTTTTTEAGTSVTQTGGESSGLPKWLIPAAIGVVGVAAIAMSKKK